MSIHRAGAARHAGGIWAAVAWLEALLGRVPPSLPLLALRFAIAVFLIDRNRRFLVGEAVRPEVRERVLRDLLARADIERITYLHLEFVGPGRLYLVASVDMVGDDVEPSLAVRLRRVERELEKEEHIEEAVLTLATPDEVSLVP